MCFLWIYSSFSGTESVSVLSINISSLCHGRGSHFSHIENTHHWWKWCWKIQVSILFPLSTFVTFWYTALIMFMPGSLTRAPLGYFYNAPHWGRGGISSPPLISETTGPILKIQAAFESPGKNCWEKTNCIDLGVTSDVTGQVKVKMFDISGLVTSVSKIAMLSTNKAN